MNIKDKSILIRRVLGEIASEHEEDVTSLYNLYNKPPKAFAIKHYGSIEKYKKMLLAKLKKIINDKAKKDNSKK